MKANRLLKVHKAASSSFANFGQVSFRIFSDDGLTSFLSVID